MKLGILGPLLVSDDTGRELRVAAPRQRTLLAALLVRANRMVPVGELAEIVWDGTPPTGAARTLRSYVVRLRHAVGPDAAARILTRDPGYLCRIADDELDVLRFEALSRLGATALRERSWEPARAALGEALALWRGAPLADIGSHLLHQEFTGRLEQARLQAVEWRIDADLQLGRHDQLVPELQALIGAQPLREHGHAALMLALYRSGRGAEALAAFHDARRVLVRELGVEPGPQLQDLHRRILARELVPGGPPTTDPAQVERATVAVPRQLPPAVRHFTGREPQLAALSRLAAPAGDGTAVVISAIGGTAGVGKTALAVQWAHRIAHEFPDGQLYVNLRGYDNGPPLPATDALAGFLGALGVPGPQIPADAEERAAAYRSRLAGRCMLIVLDNVDRPEQVRPLLPGTAGCVVLVTSRDTLTGLVARDGAARLELDVLPADAAVALLRELIGNRVDDDPAAAATLAERCSRLPLALRLAAELAAARPGVPVAELAGELADVRHRLDLLDAGGDEDTAVRAVFSWSYRHLDPVAARAFRLAGLHPGTDFDGYALAALLDTDPRTAGRLLSRLAQAHLLHPAGVGRYAMHDLLREYARELADTEDGTGHRAGAVARLFDWYLHTAAAALDVLFPAEVSRRPRLDPYAGTLAPVDQPAAARAWLDAERATLIATAGRSADGEGPPTHAALLAATLERYLTFGRHLPEAVVLHGHALGAARRLGDPTAEATALTNLGFLEWEQGHSRQAADYQRRARALFEAVADTFGVCRALHRLALAERHLGNLGPAAEHAADVLALCRRAGDRLGEARALQSLGTTRRLQGHFTEAARLFGRVLALLDELGDRRTRSVTVKELGIIGLRQGRLAAAGELMEESLALCREAGNQSGAAEALSQLGLLHHHRGEHQRAVECQREALAVHRDFADRHGEAEVLVRLARVELPIGRTGDILGHLQPALRISRSIDARLVETDVLDGLGETMLAARRPQDAAAHFGDELTLAGRTGNRDAQARSRYGLARAHEALGDRAQTQRHLRAALAIYTELAVPEAAELRARLVNLDALDPA